MQSDCQQKSSNNGENNEKIYSSGDANDKFSHKSSSRNSVDEESRRSVETPLSSCGGSLKDEPMDVCSSADKPSNNEMSRCDDDYMKPRLGSMTAMAAAAMAVMAQDRDEDCNEDKNETEKETVICNSQCPVKQCEKETEVKGDKPDNLSEVVRYQRNGDIFNDTWQSQNNRTLENNNKILSMNSKSKAEEPHFQTSAEKLEEDSFSSNVAKNNVECDVGSISNISKENDSTPIDKDCSKNNIINTATKAPDLPVANQCSEPESEWTSPIMDISDDPPTSELPSSANSLAPSANNMAPSANSLAPSANNMAPSANSMAPSTNSLAPSANSLAPSANSLAPFIFTSSATPIDPPKQFQSYSAPFLDLKSHLPNHYIRKNNDFLQLQSLTPHVDSETRFLSNTINGMQQLNQMIEVPARKDLVSTSHEINAINCVKSSLSLSKSQLTLPLQSSCNLPTPVPSVNEDKQPCNSTSLEHQSTDLKPTAEEVNDVSLFEILCVLLQILFCEGNS